LRSARAADRPSPPRLLLQFPLSATQRAGTTHTAAARRVGAASVLVGIAYLWLPSVPVLAPPPWLGPVAGLLALRVPLALVAGGLGRQVLRPLAAMSLAADRMAGGDLDVRLPDSRAREVAEVAAALAGMSASLQSALQRQVALEEERRLFIGA